MLVVKGEKMWLTVVIFDLRNNTVANCSDVVIVRVVESGIPREPNASGEHVCRVYDGSHSNVASGSIQFLRLIKIMSGSLAPGGTEEASKSVPPPNTGLIANCFFERR